MAKKLLSDADKDFIRNNFKSMLLHEIASKLNCKKESVEDYIKNIDLPQVAPQVNNGTVVMTREASEGQVRKDPPTHEETRIHRCKSK